MATDDGETCEATRMAMRGCRTQVGDTHSRVTGTVAEATTVGTDRREEACNGVEAATGGGMRGSEVVECEARRRNAGFFLVFLKPVRLSQER